MKELQAAFFDFDGVVLDSVHIKTRAFAQLYRQYGREVEEAVVAYHLAHGGISRFEKFKHFHGKFLGLELSEQDLQALGEAFEGLVLEQVMKAPFIAGAKETLVRLKEARVPAFVVSGTPEGEVRHIVASRGLAEVFAEVHGSPRKKSDILLDILRRHGFEKGCTLFFGDAKTDYDAASTVGVPFMGIVATGEPSPFPECTPISPEVRLPADILLKLQQKPLIQD